MNQSPEAILDQLDAPFRAQLDTIGANIGYGRACQLLGELWDEMLVREGIPAGRGAMERRIDLEAIEQGLRPINQEALDAINALSPRQRESALLIAQGAPQSVVAERLGIAEGTVRAHAARIYAALGIKSARELTAMAVLAGLITDWRAPK